MVDVGTTKLYYYGNDQLGTPEILTDSTNTVVWEAIYKPFGEAEVNEHSTVVNNFRFPGQYYDEETGLHYNYYRYYDPSTGRYLTPDPIGLFSGVNVFLYARNNPINHSDSDGLLIDTLADFGFMLWDIWNIITAENPCERKDSITALALDTGGLFTPFVTGLGKAYKFGKKGSKLIHASKSARSAPIEYTKSGERFVRVGNKAENLKFTFENPGGTQKGTYAFPEETFNKIGRDPAKLKDLGDLPGAEPNYYRILEPPAGTPIQRGTVPGGEFGGRGRVPEVIFPEGF
jgi:RHS repeat-associated protein